MRLAWKPMPEGFVIEASREGGDVRTRKVAWEASAGELRECGVIDLACAEAPFELPVRTGWMPDSVAIEPIRDQTPGAWQPWRSTIPAGVCEISFETTQRFSFRIDLLVSPSGHPADVRSVASLDGGTPDGQVSFAVPSKTTWCLLMLKKMVRSDEAAGIRDVRVFHPASGQRFEASGHLVKPEHKALEKVGPSGLLFRPDAPPYAYFSIGFQKVP